MNEQHKYMHHQQHNSEHTKQRVEDQDETFHKLGEQSMHYSDMTTPFYVSVLVGVTHCGAGCVLGDIVGEWIIYGTNVTIDGRTLWPEMLIGIARALSAP